jgi:hypothetical protein
MSNGIPVTFARATEELREYRHGLLIEGLDFYEVHGRP